MVYVHYTERESLQKRHILIFHNMIRMYYAIKCLKEGANMIFSNDVKFR